MGIWQNTLDLVSVSAVGLWHRKNHAKSPRRLESPETLRRRRYTGAVVLSPGETSFCLGHCNISAYRQLLVIEMRCKNGNTID